MKYKGFLMAALMSAAVLPAMAQSRTDLQVVLASPTQTLDPQRTPSVLSASILKLSYERLTQVSPEGSVEPLLAESWTAEEGGLSWLVKLRDGIRFHDGAVFDAAAVVANFERVLDPNAANPVKSNVGPVSAVELVDEHTVRIRTSRPFSGLPIALSHNAVSMISPNSLKDADNGGRALAGTGPFKIKDFALPDRVTFERNDDYWGEKPKLTEIEALSRSDDQTRLAAFLSGEADLDFYLTPESRGRAEGSPDLDLINIPSIRLFVVHLPMGLPEMQDVRVRKALNLAVDRNQIIATLYQGAAEPGNTAIGPGVFGYRAGTPYAYDPGQAAELLEQAGWKKDDSGILVKDGKPFPTVPLLASRGRQPGDARLAQIIAGYLKAVGIPTDLQISEFATFFAEAQKESKTGGKFVQMAWGFPQMDGAAFICSVYKEGDGYNFANYANPAVAKACTDIDAAFDPEQRAKLIGDAAQAVYEDAPAIFLVSPSYLVGQRKGLAGIVLNSGENHLLGGGYWQ